MFVDHENVVRLKFKDGEVLRVNAFHGFDWIIFISEIFIINSSIYNLSIFRLYSALFFFILST